MRFSHYDGLTPKNESVDNIGVILEFDETEKEIGSYFGKKLYMKSFKDVPVNSSSDVLLLELNDCDIIYATYKEKAIGSVFGNYYVSSSDENRMYGADNNKLYYRTSRNNVLLDYTIFYVKQEV